MVKLLKNFLNRSVWFVCGAAALALLLWFLVFAPVPAVLQNREWELETVQTADGSALWIPTPGRFTVKFDNYKVNGAGPCNSFSGTVHVTRVFSAMTFRSVFHTLVACLPSADNDHESAFFAALGSATKYEVKADKLYVYFDDSTQVLVFR